MDSQPGNGSPNHEQEQQQSNPPTNRENQSQTRNENETDNGPSDAPSGPSLISRIQDSATGLARNAFFTPGSSTGMMAGEMAQGMLSSSGKGGGSRSSASASASGVNGLGLLSRQQPGGSGSGSGSGGRFRAHRNADLDMEQQEQEQERFESGVIPAQDGFSPEFTERAYDNLSITNSDLDILPAMDSSGNWNGKGKGMGKSAVRDQTEAGRGTGTDPDFIAAWERSKQQQQQQQSTSDGPIALPNDGAAVVSLLADPSFDPDLTLTTTANTSTITGTAAESDFDFNLDFDPIQEYEQPLPVPLSVEEMKLLESFRRRDPHHTADDTSERRRRMITSFSLIPDVGPFLLNNNNHDNHNQQDQHGQGQGLSDNDRDLRDLILSSLPGATDWLPLEEGYHDEVWGYLRPVLEAAKAEIVNQNQSENQKGEGGEQEGPAVRRLKGILNQMRARL